METIMLTRHDPTPMFAGNTLRSLPGRRSSVHLAIATLIAVGFTSFTGCARRPEVKSFEIIAAPTTVPLSSGRTIQVWAYNGQVPGPTLRIRLGDTLRVTFTNRLPQPTTIHWHGVRVPNAMDGVPGVTQRPVEPGQTFVYEFTPKDAGTFWFHPHVRASEQVERGLYGVLIVDDPEPQPFARDELWVIDDLLLDPSGEIAPEFNTRHDLAHDGRWGNFVVVNGRSRPELRAAPGERLRLRLLNVANGRVFLPDFGALRPQIIAVDGLYVTAPVDARGFELAPGNRVDLDLVVPAALAGSRVSVVDRFTRQAIGLADIVVASDAVTDSPRFSIPVGSRIPDAPSTGSAQPPLELRLNAEPGGPFGIAWTINGTAMNQLDHASGGEHYALPLNEPSRVRFVNESYRLHPMHLHGMFFRVVSRNSHAIDEPFTRDTVLVHPKETVEVVTLPTEPGLWMAHCHVLEHAEAGMMTLLDVH